MLLCSKPGERNSHAGCAANAFSRPPDAAARVRDPVAALRRRAVWVDHCVRRAAGRDVLVRHVDVPVAGRVERIDRVVRPAVVPLAVVAEPAGRVAAGLERRPVLPAARDRRERDVIARGRVLEPVVGAVTGFLGSALARLVLRLGRREPLRPSELLHERRGQLALPQLGRRRRRALGGVGRVSALRRRAQPRAARPRRRRRGRAAAARASDGCSCASMTCLSSPKHQALMRTGGAGEPSARRRGSAPAGAPVRRSDSARTVQPPA